MTLNRIRWTSRERGEVITAAAKKLNEGYKIGDALRAAQYVLEPDRRRPETSLYNAADIIAAARKLANATVPPKHGADIAAVKANMQPIQQKVVVSSAHPVPQAEGSIDALIDAIARRIASTVKTEIVKAVKELEHEFKVARNNPEYEANGKTKPRVTIIGLREDQMSMIEHEYANRYSFKFLTADDAKGSIATDADAYLLMKNFISHAVFEKYQIYKNYVLIDGGMTALRGWLSTKGVEL